MVNCSSTLAPNFWELFLTKARLGLAQSAGFQIAGSAHFVAHESEQRHPIANPTSDLSVLIFDPHLHWLQVVHTVRSPRPGTHTQIPTSSATQHASSNQTRPEPVRLGDHGLPQHLRKLPTRKSLRTDAKGRPWSRYVLKNPSASP